MESPFLNFCDDEFLHQVGAPLYFLSKDPQLAIQFNSIDSTTIFQAVVTDIR